MMSMLARLLRQRFHLLKLQRPLHLKRCAAGTGRFAGFLGLWLATAAITSSVAVAGGAATGGATEWTQVMNNVQLADSYAQDVNRYQNEIMRYEIMVRNIQDNPVGGIVPNLNQLVQNQARIMQYGSDIGSNMSKVDQNFAKQFNNPQAQSFGVKFGVTANVALDALKAAMLNVGLQHENSQTDSQNIQRLTDKVKAADGNQGALKALGDLNAAQLQEAQLYRQVFADQSMAVNTAMAADATQKRDASAANDQIQASFVASKPATPPVLDTTPPVYKKWGFYSK
jgi:P-type conjugative transfer protein TrbJ